MADTNTVTVAYGEETGSYGEVPAGPPTLKEVRLRNFDARENLNASTSQERDANYDHTGWAALSANAEVTASGELSYGMFDDWLAWALRSSGWSTAVDTTEATYSFAASNNSINDSANGFVTAGYVAGQWIKVTGASVAGNNGLYKISSVAAGEMVLAYGTVADESAGASIRVNQGGQVVNGTDLTTIFTEEKLVAAEFKHAPGLSFGGFGITLEDESFALINFSMQGKGVNWNSATVGDGSNTAAPNNQRMNSTLHLFAVFEKNAELADVMSLALNLNTNPRHKRTLGSETPTGQNLGTFDPTGSFSVYFANDTLATRFKNRASSTFAFALVDDAGNGYLFELPEVRFQATAAGEGERDQDLMYDVEFQGIRNATEGISMRIQRFAA